MKTLALTLLGGLALQLAWSAPSGAQTTQQVVAKAAADAEKKAIVAANLELSEEEAKAFWPVYDEYQLGLGKLDTRLAELLSVYAETWKSLSEPIAKDMLEDYLDIERDRLGLRSGYVKRFRRVLPETKVLRYYQLENKLHATVQFGLAEKVPLAQ